MKGVQAVILLLLSILLGVIVTVEGASSSSSCPHQLSGLVRWSQWQSAPTSAGATVSIGASTAILLDVSPPVIEHIDVYGTLVFDPAVPSINVTVGSIYVRNGGRMYLGSSECPLSNSVTINLKGAPQPNVDPVGLGTKVLGVLSGGLLEIHGKPRLPVWTVLDATAEINSTSITLAEDVDWAVGETIVIATTDFELFDDSPDYAIPTQNEVVTVTARPSTKVVQFTPALKYTHYGKIWTGQNGDWIDLRGEVGLISRNILIQGDLSTSLSGDSAAKEWGGHVMIRDGGIGRIEYIEVTKVGQKGEFGRYPLHFHNSSAQPDSYLRGNSIHDTFQRCIVVHSTFNLRVQNNIAYRGKGHCYFVEDGNEEENVFDHNLGIKALVGTLLTSDNEPAMFWITNPHNHFYRNVAVGGKMGYWYSMPSSPLALSAADVTNKLRYKISGDFSGNKAHSGNVGLFVDRGLENAKPGSANQLTSYNPTNWTAAVALSKIVGTPIDVTKLGEYELTVAGFRVPAVFINFTAYKNVEEGMWGRGSYMYSYGAKLADNQVGAIWPGFANLMQNTLIVGETDNIGTYNLRRNPWWGDEEGRTRAVKYFLDSPVLGYSSYDASGGDMVIDISFYNFNDYTFKLGSNAGKIRKTGALTGLTGPNVIEPINRVYRAKFYNVQRRVYYREYYPWEQDLAATDDAVKGVVWVDADGSILSGLTEAGCGKTIVGPSPHVRTSSSCVQKSDWNAWICNANSNAHRAFYLSQSASPSAYLNETEMRLAYDLHLTRLSDSAKVDIEADLGQYSGDLLSADYSYGTNIVANNIYYVTLGNKNTFLSDFSVRMNDLAVGEKVRFAFPFSGSSTPTVKYGYQGANAAVEVLSYSALTINSYYFDKTANLLWIQLEVSDVSYEYYFGLPMRSTYVEMDISSNCATNSDKLCTYPAQSVPTNPGNLPSVTANLCENNGAVTGGVTTYTSKSPASYVVFDESFPAIWDNTTNKLCNFTSDLTYEGSTALRCRYAGYNYGSYARIWNSYTTTIGPSSYTHLQFAVRAAPGHGEILLGVNIFNRSYTHFTTAPVHSPFYTDNAGPITDNKWSLVRVPLADFKMPAGNDLWGIAFTSSNARPVEFYLDSIKLVSLNQQVTAISNYPPAPATPSIVGPGPSDAYGTDPPVVDTTTGASSDQDNSASKPFFFALSVIAMLASLLL